MSATRVWVLGGGGREHAMLRALATSRNVRLFGAPGNPGIASLATPLPSPDLPSPDRPSPAVAALVQVARDQAIDLVVPGPEAILAAGVADGLAQVGIACCGPSAAAARIETSKAFARRLSARLGIRGPRFAIVDDVASLSAALEKWPGLPVIKADGLAGGKGVFLPASHAECLATATALLAGSLGAAGRTVLLEERLHGEEASLFFACHGADCVPLLHARDHKRLLDGDRGPNTGGMGAVSPSPSITPAIEKQVREQIVQPTLRALQDMGTPFVGFLFVGLMLTADGPALIEFNARLGDPEAQAILPRLANGEFLRLCLATARGKLADFALQKQAGCTCAVVLASPGYPTSPELDQPITVDEAALSASQAWLVHSGTRKGDDDLRTAGGRVLTVVARADSAHAAQKRAYQAVDFVQFSGRQFRRDIGHSIS